MECRASDVTSGRLLARHAARCVGYVPFNQRVDECGTVCRPAAGKHQPSGRLFSCWLVVKNRVLLAQAKERTRCTQQLVARVCTAQFVLLFQIHDLNYGLYIRGHDINKCF